MDKDINIKGTISGIKSNNINGNINTNINLKGPEIKISNDINENKPQINNILNSNNKNISQNINISPVNINIEKEIKTKNNNIPKNKKEIDNNIINSIPDYNLNGNIPGTKKIIYINNNTNDKKNINKNQQPKELFKMTGIIKGTGEKNKNIKDKNINNKTKEINKKIEITQGIKINSPPGKEKKLSIPKLDLEGKIPEFSEYNNNINNNINIKPHMINLKGTSNDNINHFSPTFNINANNHKNNNNNELIGENITYSFNNGNIQGSKIDISSFDNMNFKEIQFEQKNLGVTKINLNNNEDNNNIGINLKTGVNPGNTVNNNPFIINANQVNNSLFNNNDIQKINLNTNYNNANNIQNGNNGNENNLNNNNIYLSSQNNIISRQSTKTKVKALPLVGIKNDTFVSSKVEPINSLDVENFDVKNLKSTNVGINGIKLGERIDH